MKFERYLIKYENLQCSFMLIGLAEIFSCAKSMCAVQKNAFRNLTYQFLTTVTNFNALSLKTALDCFVFVHNNYEIQQLFTTAQLAAFKI